MKNILFAVLFLTGCAATSVRETAFSLVEDGKPVCSIVATGNKTVDADIAFFTNDVRGVYKADNALNEN